MVCAVLRGIVDDGSEKKADGDRPLVSGDDGAADPFGGALGLVHGDEGGDEADTETGEEAADDEGGPVGGAGLEGDTEGEDNAGEDEADAATEDVRNGGTAESAWKRDEGQRRPTVKLDIPKKVPAERMETTRDSFPVDWDLPSGLMAVTVPWNSLPNVASQSSMAMIPEMVPVS